MKISTQSHTKIGYPFGMIMPGRSFTSDNYRYGYQGQEKDDEIKGAGNSLNYEYRMHDPRLGRFFMIDPLAKKYPYYSQYAFSGNRVIDAVELEGLEPDRLVETEDIGKPRLVLGSDHNTNSIKPNILDDLPVSKKGLFTQLFDDLVDKLNFWDRNNGADLFNPSEAEIREEGSEAGKVTQDREDQDYSPNAIKNLSGSRHKDEGYKVEGKPIPLSDGGFIRRDEIREKDGTLIILLITTDKSGNIIDTTNRIKFNKEP